MIKRHIVNARREFINTVAVLPSEGFQLELTCVQSDKARIIRWKKQCHTLLDADRFQHLMTLVTADIGHHDHYLLMDFW